MTVGKKISLACLALVGLTILLGTVSIWNGERINTAVHAVVVDSLPGTSAIGRLDSLMKEQRVFAAYADGDARTEEPGGIRNCGRNE